MSNDGNWTREERRELYNLGHHALVIPAQFYKLRKPPETKPVALAHGSLVYAAVGPVAPLLDDWFGERPITYIDSAGREQYGHVDSSTVLVPAPKAREPVSIGWQPADGSRLPIIDVLRERVTLARTTSVAYLNTHRSAAHLALYSAIIRERGGNVKATDDADRITERLARMILTQEARDMARKQAVAETEEQDEQEETEQEEAPRAKRSAKKAAAKKGAAKRAANESNGEGRTPMGVSLGKALVPLLREAGVKGDALKTAKALESGETVKKAQLIALRDSVNEAAAAAREEDNTKLSSQLSGANRVVRRLSRA